MKKKITQHKFFGSKTAEKIDSKDITARYELTFPKGSLRKALAFGREMRYTHERDGEYAALLLSAAMAGVVGFDIEIEELA